MYRRSLLWGMGVLVLLVAAAGCSRKPIQNTGSGGQNIICFGDSITLGYGVNLEEAYPAALAALTGLPVINAGVDGDTSKAALLRLKADVLTRNPRLVIVEFGGNDFLRKIPREETFDNVRSMLRRIQAQGAMVAIADVSAGLFMREYRWTLRRIAKEEGALFIPGILRGIITDPRLKTDAVHPNAAGYKLIAQRIAAVIMPYLTSRSNSSP